jgi:hypothetical protein
MTPRVQAILNMRLSRSACGEWIFRLLPVRMEPSTPKKQHAKAIGQATVILRKQTGREDIEFKGFEL